MKRDDLVVRGRRSAREVRTASRHLVTDERPARVEDFPVPTLSAWGARRRENLRGPIAAAPPLHRASSLTIGAAYPFLAETGGPIPGPVLGENMQSRSSFSFDPWNAYSAGEVRSNSMVLQGVKGSGKSMFAKTFATRICRMGRKVAVLHDPNAEWTAVAEYVGGVTIAVGPGRPSRINPLDPGQRPADVDEASWNLMVRHRRSATVRAIVMLLRMSTRLDDVEHTAIDLALEATTARRTDISVLDIWDELRAPTTPELRELADDTRPLIHTMRRLTVGDLAGSFDGPSTVRFDNTAPMLTVDTSALANASTELKAISRLATTNWVRQATIGANRVPRLMVHEEAAVALMNEVAMGATGLSEIVEDEKVARHRGKANLWIIHRFADFSALGDEGSAVQKQALGLIADCDTRISYAQNPAEIPLTAQILGWNERQALMVQKLRRGEGLWQIGPDRMAMVRNECTPYEESIFRTDTKAGARA